MDDFVPSLADLITAAIEAHSADVHVAMPGTVSEYYPETQTADVQPVFTKTFYDEDGVKHTEQIPSIHNVPIAFPSGGPFAITWPLSKGDPVLLVFADRNIGEWQETGNAGDPGDARTHELSGAFAIPGGRPTPKATTHANRTDLVISGPSIRMGSVDASQAIVLGDILRSILAGHTHGTGTGPTTPPIQAATFSQFLSTRHKIDE